jgi:hypothetical protein
MANQSPIHAPLDAEDIPAPPPATRISRLAALDRQVLAGRAHSLGPGGASSLFFRAVDKALVDEIAEQLREGPFEISAEDGEVRKWAKDIITAFEEEE